MHPFNLPTTCNDSSTVSYLANNHFYINRYWFQFLHIYNDRY